MGRRAPRDLSMSVASTAAKVLFGRDLLRLAVGSIGLLALGFAAVVFAILLLLKSLLGLAASSANLGLLPGPDSGASAGPPAAIIPADQLAVMEQVAAATPCAKVCAFGREPLDAWARVTVGGALDAC